MDIIIEVEHALETNFIVELRGVRARRLYSLSRRPGFVASA